MALSPVFSNELQNEIDRVLKIFEGRGAKLIEASTLLPASIMLDLYGEDIRNRAYLVHDAIDGDLVLRPDFTVPVVEYHMEKGAEPARYAYSGRVWRRRRLGDERKHSFWQIGYELFDRGERAKNDCEVFALANEISKPNVLNAKTSAKTGDLSLIFGVLDELIEVEWRREALKRHVWRPRAFMRLLERYASGEAKHAGIQLGDAPHIGLRSRAMIEARLERLAEDAKLPPIAEDVKALIERLSTLKGNLATAADELAGLVKNWPMLEKMAEVFSLRNDALLKAGIDPSMIDFDAGFARETMEYYDGFVFGFYGQAQSAVISGGRYNRLTEVLGRGRDIPAIGLAYRPELILGAAS